MSRVQLALRVPDLQASIASPCRTPQAATETSEPVTAGGRCC